MYEDWGSHIDEDLGWGLLDKQVDVTKVSE
jgi:hypothetical protein